MAAINKVFIGILIVSISVATRFGLGVADIGKIEFSARGIDEQKKIALILRTMDNGISLLVSLRESWSKLKNGLMQKLLTGKIRVKT